MGEQQYAIEMRGICKSFGSVAANKNVNLNVKPGEILALLGENGSGKTTLMNMLSGIYKPDSGSIFVDGREVAINSPEDAKKLGIGMVHQHFKLVDVFSAADNIWLGDEKSGGILKKDRYGVIGEMAKQFGFDIDPRKKVYNMAVSEKQTLEIVKVLYYGARIIILDEPTAVLTVQETARLFDVLRRMRASGHAIIIITHKLNEVMELSDRVAILRKGEYITTVDTAATSEQALTEYMVGRKVELNIDRPVVEKTRPLLEIRDLTIKNDEGATAIDRVNFYIRGGRDPGGGRHRRLRPEGAVRGHRRPAAHRKRPDDPQGGQHRGPAPQGHSGKRYLHVLYPRGPARHGSGPLHVYHGQHAPQKIRPDQGALCGPKDRPGGGPTGDR